MKNSINNSVNINFKSIVRSIKPYWFYLVCEGIKTLEIGKTEPHNSNWNRTVYLYCTKDQKSFNKIPETFQEKYRKYLGTVGAKFICNEIIFLGNISTEPWDRLCGNVHEYHKRLIIENARLTENELLDYGGQYAWRISKLEVYESPKQISEFVVEGDCECINCNRCVWFERGNGFNIENDCILPFQYNFKTVKPLFRPPQSWCYIVDG